MSPAGFQHCRPGSAAARAAGDDGKDATGAESTAGNPAAAAPATDGATTAAADGSTAALTRERHQQAGGHSGVPHGALAGPAHAQGEYPSPYLTFFIFSPAHCVFVVFDSISDSKLVMFQ